MVISRRLYKSGLNWYINSDFWENLYSLFEGFLLPNFQLNYLLKCLITLL